MIVSAQMEKKRVPKNKRRYFEENKTEIIKLFRENVSFLDMEDTFSISRVTIKKYLDELGIKRTEREKQLIMQSKREQSMLKKYGVVNISQVDNPDIQKRRVAGAIANGRKSWSGKGNPNYKNKIGNSYGYKSGTRKDLGCYFRSSWEANYARFLNFSSVKWEFEKQTFELSNGTTYTPDFYITEKNKFVEVKGYWRDDAKEKYTRFLKEYPDIKIEVFGEKEYRELKSKYSKTIKHFE